LLVWRKKWKSVLEWKEPFAQWFVGGKLNVSENCLDRHLSGPRRNKAALIWEGEPGEKRTLTYHQLHREVCKFANVLKRNQIKMGDRVIIYMPMCPEAAIAMLACARLGIIHSVVFGGFSSAAIKDRVNDTSFGQDVLNAAGPLELGPACACFLRAWIAMGVERMTIAGRLGPSDFSQCPREYPSVCPTHEE
jgi:hypothetical protein